MANTGITITVNAQTAQAAAQLQQFFAGATGGLNRLSSLAAQLSGPLAALLSVGGLIALSRSAINLADSFGKLSRSAGVTTEEFTGLAYAAERNELGMDGLRAGLKGFTEYLVKTGQGSRNVRDALLEQAAIFERMPDGAAKSSLALERFGRAGVQMLPLLNEGPAAIALLFERGVKLSGITDASAQSADQFNDALTDLKWAAQGLAGTLSTSLLPKLTELINSLTAGLVRFREWTRESETFRLSLEALAVTLGVLAARKVAVMSTTGLAAFIGAGSIKSLTDFVAALKLFPAAAAAAAASIGPIVLAVTALTAALIIGLKHWQMWNAKANEQDTIKAVTVANEDLAASILRVAEARRAAGELTDAGLLEIRQRLEQARSAPTNQQANDDLRALAQSLRQPAGGTSGNQWTREELDLQNKLLSLESDRVELLRAKDQSNYREFQALEFLTVQREHLARLEQLSVERAENAFAAQEQGAISNQEFQVAELQRNRELFAIEQARLEIRNEEFTRRAADIEADFTLDDAQKFSAQDALAKERNPVFDQTAADPASMADQWEVAMVKMRNNWGTFQQYVANGLSTQIVSGIGMVSSGIAEALVVTGEWGQMFQRVAQQMLAQLVQVAVQALLVAAILTPLGLGGFAGAGGGGGGLFGGLFGGARAEGGPVAPGYTHLVGERGPELFVPSTQGYIHPLPMSGSGAAAGPQGGGEMTVVVVYDQSGLKRVLESNAGKKIIIKHVGDSRADLGLNT